MSQPSDLASESTELPDVAPQPWPPHRGLPGRGVTFLLPGQGSQYAELLRQLCALGGSFTRLLDHAQARSRHLLGHSLEPLLQASSEEERQARQREHPGAEQLCVYLAGVLMARLLIDRGIRPDLLVGHSAGELAALAVGGAYSFETGIEVVCHRVRALRAHACEKGGKRLLFCSESRARAALELLGETSLDVAVVNHATQRAVAGPLEALHRLAELARAARIELRELPSLFPFHSRHLESAVAPFREALDRLALSSRTSIPVYSPMEGALFGDRFDLAKVLPSHFVRPLRFDAAVRALYRGGMRTFVDCSGGVLAQIVRHVLSGAPGIETHNALPPEALLEDAVESLARAFEQRGLARARTASARTKSSPSVSSAPAAQVEWASSST